MIATSDIVTLRLFKPEDLNAFCAYRADPDVARFQSWEPMDKARARRFIAHVGKTTSLFQPGAWTQIALADPTSDDLIGDMGLHLSADETEVELGITLAKQYWRQGIATQAMRLAISQAFKDTSATHILAGAERLNSASIALIKKLGFVYNRSEPPPGAPADAPATDDIFLFHRP